jgi:putative chitinase
VGLLTGENLKAIMPKADTGKWLDFLNQALERFSINTTVRAAAFLAQIAHESDELTHVSENLNYSAQRLTQVWPKRFPTVEIAREYEHNPEKLANYIYASRLGNGDEASGDGWKFRGRGLIQLTGKTNYTQAGSALGADLATNPDLVAQPEYASLTAVNFWKTNGLNELADLSTDESFVNITKKINGGTVGMDSRKAYWTRAKQVLGIS